MMNLLAAMDPATFNKIGFVFWLSIVAGVMYFFFPLVVWSYLGQINKRLQNIEDRLAFMTPGQKRDSPPDKAP